MKKKVSFTAFVFFVLVSFIYFIFLFYLYKLYEYVVMPFYLTGNNLLIFSLIVRFQEGERLTHQKYS